jgi:hypothetical protein
MAQNVYLVVASAFVLAGDIVTAGELVEVTDSEARDLLGRGMARVATAEDGVPQAGDIADFEAVIGADDAPGEIDDPAAYAAALESGVITEIPASPTSGKTK